MIPHGNDKTTEIAYILSPASSFGQQTTQLCILVHMWTGTNRGHWRLEEGSSLASCSFSDLSLFQTKTLVILIYISSVSFVKQGE